MPTSIDLAALGFGGFDTTNLVKSLVSLSAQPMNMAQALQQQVQAATATITNFANALSTLKTASLALNDPTTFRGMKATSTDASIAATTSGSPTPGQWTLSVSAIAKAQRTVSSGTASSTSALGVGGALHLTLGSGGSADIDISGSDTLSDVASEISSSSLGVHASVMYDGAQYRLVVSGLATGAAGSFSFDESGLAGSGFNLGLSTAANTTQAAQDASLQVGGIAITSPSNQIANAIPGVTLAITQPTTTPATLTVAADSSSLQTRVQSFVDAYNVLVVGGHSVAGYGTQKAQIALLQSDRAVRSTLDQVGHLMSSVVPGATGAYTTLGSVGVSLQPDGTLKLDATKFQAAQASDASSVERLFETDPSTGATGIMGSFISTVDSATSSTSGAVTAELKGFADRDRHLTTQIASQQQRLAGYQTSLTAQFTRMNAALAHYKQVAASLTAAFRTNNSGNGTAL
jgi:flagellar hook-associated protein 2